MPKVIQIGNEKILLDLKYTLIGRILLLSLAIFSFFVGSIFLSSDNTNIFLLIFGGILILYGLFLFIDNILFKRFILTEQGIIKMWIFGSYSCTIDNLKNAYRQSYNFLPGSLRFTAKNRFFMYYIMSINLIGTGNVSETMRKVKKAFIQVGLIKGDEYEWNY